jgi:hypothetical protein
MIAMLIANAYMDELYMGIYIYIYIWIYNALAFLCIVKAELGG